MIWAFKILYKWHYNRILPSTICYLSLASCLVLFLMQHKTADIYPQVFWRVWSRPLVFSKHNSPQDTYTDDHLHRHPEQVLRLTLRASRKDHFLFLHTDSPAGKYQDKETVTTSLSLHLPKEGGMKWTHTKAQSHNIMQLTTAQFD